MAAPTISESLQYAKLQMAAEAFLMPKTGGDPLSGQDLIDALVIGNLHASRFPNIQDATDFLSQWQVVAQQPNTNTGFSGTLFKKVGSDEYVISMRSTEFVDDAVRDNESSNKEIKNFGWALGQIDDMRRWYSDLQTSAQLPGGANLSVTGYSLGGHLATAFNLLYPTAANKVVTFNGAGVGTVQGLGLAGQQLMLTTMMSDFRDLRGNARTLMGTPEGQQLYDNVKTKLNAARAAGALTGGLVSIWIDELRTTDATVAEAADRGRLSAALDRVRTMVLESERIKDFHPAVGNVTTPVIAEQSKTDAESLDYQLALLATRDNYHTAPLGLVSGAFNTFFGKTPPPGGGLSNQYELVGTEMDGATAVSMVAHSQYHYGLDAPVFIEDQPGLRGTALRDAVGQSFSENANPRSHANDMTWSIAA